MNVATDKPRNKISCRLELLPGETVLEKINNAANFGFDAVALPERYLNNYLTELRECFQNRLLPLSSLSLGFEGSLVSPDPERRKRCRESLKKLFDICVEFFIPVLTVPPVLIMDNPERCHDQDIQNQLLLEQLPELADNAKCKGVNICLEPVNCYESEYMNTVAEAVKICRTLNHPAVAVNIDFFHMQIEELNPPEAILDAGKWIGHVHIADNTRLEPGTGIMDFTGNFAALKQTGYSGYIEVEARKLSGNPEQVPPSSIRFLNKILFQLEQY